MKKILFASVSLFCFLSWGQNQMGFTQDDYLRGSITPEREWWDLTFYHLDIEVKPDEKFIQGQNTIRYKVLNEKDVMQIDLQPPLKIDKIVQNGKELSYRKEGRNAYMVLLVDVQKPGQHNELIVHYSGNPKEAIRAPWDGGFSWKKDNNGKHFVATSCQGLGASVWWPNKDHMYDEVDSMAISVTTPKDLMNVSNGRLKRIEENETTKTTHWYIDSPINNYGVNVNIGDYVHFTDSYDGEKGTLDIDYYVLRDNLNKAKEQFKQTKPMLEAFEHWFGPYPFYEDGFKLVEAPYLGMEHQSSVTYGNGYQNGYRGTDLSDSGWGLKFDFIIVHESGHEWFANNITHKDIADMWVHEGFTSYSENLFLDYHYGTKAAAEYVTGTRKRIMNDKPIIGRYNLNRRGSGDMYYKGANMLHTLRQLIDNDQLWRQILRGLNKTFYHETVTTEQVENYISKKSEKDLSAFFEQYLRTTKIPVLEYEFDGSKLKYRYTNVVKDFDMPVRIFLDGKAHWVFPKKDSQWKTEKVKGKELIVDSNFYIKSQSL
ncbi:MAG: M1 family metallopeptidase [Croceivirga sp.]